MGVAQPYPTFYLVGFVLWPLAGVFKSLGITALIVFVTLWFASTAAMGIARNNGANPMLVVALGCFAALNPWVFQKYVAGHVLMVSAYAILLGIIAETGRSKARAWLLVPLAALSIVQIEFFAIAFVPFLIWTCRARAFRPAAAAIIAAIPIAYGIAASYAQVHSTPFNLSWQIGQSVSPLDAALLGGGQSLYGRAFEGLWLASAVFALAALAGLGISLFRPRRDTAIVIVSFAAFLLATGTKGPIAIAYTWAVEHFTEIGLFRELYDLIGIVAIGFVVAIARGFADRPRASLVIASAAVSFAIPWLFDPPSKLFVPQASVPVVELPRSPSYRVALLPAFQPMSLGDRGSGVDPDAYVADGRSIPINEAFASFPVDAALGALIFRGDDSRLRGLGVSRVVSRPWLRADFDSALRYQWLYAANPRVVCCRSHAIAGRPLLTIARGVPGIATIANHPLGDAVFFGDRLPAALVRGFEPTRATLDPQAAWVDARLAFSLRPEWGTAFGGVTTQGTQFLALPEPTSGMSLLAGAEGSLLDDRGRIVTKLPGLHWWPLRADAQRVTCNGRCIVVLEAAVPANVPEQRPPMPAAPVDVRFLHPWLAVATVPAGSGDTLRFNVQYDPAWQAYAGTLPLAHERLDETLNAWTVPPLSQPRRVVFIESVAAIQFMLEIFAALAIVGLELHALFARRVNVEAVSH